MLIPDLLRRIARCAVCNCLCPGRRTCPEHTSQILPLADMKALYAEAMREPV